MDQLVPNSAFYNVPMAYRLKGPLNVSALETAFIEVIRRHDALRASFVPAGGRPAQVIQPGLSLKLAVMDVSDLAEPEREIEARRLARTEATRPFDLGTGPLLRAGLIRLDAEDNVLLITMHHIVSDGWSVGVLVRELSTLYASVVDGRSVSLPKLSVQYSDYALWQREWLKDEKLDLQLDFWRDRLAGATPLGLPADRARPSMLTYTGARVSWVLPEALVTKVKDLCHKERATLFMTLLTGFEILLQRYTGQTDILVGSPIANRNRAEFEALIGFFVNTLVMRVDLGGDPSVRGLLKRVRQVTLGAYEHRDLPFEKLVEHLSPVRNLNRNPLVQVVFALQNTAGGELNLPGVTASFFSGNEVVTRFDQEWHVWDRGSTVQVIVHYSTDLFQASTVQRMLKHWERVLEQMVTDPEQRLSEITLLSPEERSLILTDWSRTESGANCAACVHTIFEQHTRNMPDSVACVYGSDSLTYAELNRRANRLAWNLRRLGVGPDVRVGVFAERGLDMVVSFLAILKVGGAYIPLDPEYPDHRLKYIAEDAQIRVLLTTGKFDTPWCPVQTTVARTTGEADAGSAEADENPELTISPENIAYAIYTSGSTGAPKAVAVPHRAIVRLVREMNYVEVNPGDRIAQASIASFDAATFEIWGALLNGACAVGLTKECILSPSDFTKALVEHGITIIFLTTALFNLVSQQSPTAFGTLNTVLFGGEAVDPACVRRVRESFPDLRLVHVYGPTEVTTFATWFLVDSVEPDAWTVPIGRPIANTTAYILDEFFEPVPAGVPGELCLGGPGVAREYLNAPELTAQKLVPDLFDKRPGRRLYRSGDLARWSADGNIEFLGRIDRQIKIRGFRIEPGEIEAVLRAHEAVQDAVVVTHNDSSGQKELVAYVVESRTGDFGGRSPSRSGVSEQISHWSTIYQDIYADASEDAWPDFTGWKSNYTNALIPEPEMRSWRQNTVDRILASSPQAVLELGCGLGVLTSAIAPRCDEYWCTDFSQSALDQLRKHLNDAGLSNVTMLAREACDFSGIPARKFDTVTLNSVVQYFPDLGYLLEVIDKAVAALKPTGGYLFLGDLRSLPLHEAFHASVQFYRAPDESTCGKFAQMVADQVIKDNELLVHPRLFAALKGRFPQLADVRVEPKRDCNDNELTKFRYDVTLRFGDASQPHVNVTWRDWRASEFSEARLRQFIQNERPPVLGLRGIPNGRLWTDEQVLSWLKRGPAQQTVGDCRRSLKQTVPPEWLNPEDIWTLAEESGYRVQVSWAAGHADGSFDAVLSDARVNPSLPDVDWLVPVDVPPQGYANDPLREKRSNNLVVQLRAYLETRLPSYMNPSAIVVLQSIPLTANGKVDRQALPEPSRGPAEADTQDSAPMTDIERAIAKIWADVLDVSRVGPEDDFFELGGHSLLATQAISRVREKFDIPTFPLRQIFEATTVAQLAAAVGQTMFDEVSQISETQASNLLSASAESGA